MLEVGDLVYVSLRCNGAVVSIVGWGVELADDEIVIGTLAEVVASLTQKLSIQVWFGGFCEGACASSSTEKA